METSGSEIPSCSGKNDVIVVHQVTWPWNEMNIQVIMQFSSVITLSHLQWLRDTVPILYYQTITICERFRDF